MSEWCAGAVWDGYTYRGCSRMAVKDGYCKQHHPDAVQARRDASERRYREERDAEYRAAKAKRDELEHLRAIRAQAIIDTREYIIGGSYLGERTAMMDLLGMDEVGNVNEEGE